jgi:hypothetical protein
LTKLTAKKRGRFLEVLAGGGSVTAGAAAIAVSRTALYNLRASDDSFAAEWDAAIEAGTDALEDEAVKRAKESSDTLLIFLLKGRRPQKFKDKVELGGEISHTHKVVRVPPKVSKEEWPTLVQSS